MAMPGGPGGAGVLSGLSQRTWRLCQTRKGQAERALHGMGAARAKAPRLGRGMNRGSLPRQHVAEPPGLTAQVPASPSSPG